MITKITVAFDDGSEEVLTMPVNVPAPEAAPDAPADAPAEEAAPTE